MARNKAFDADQALDKAIRVFRDKGYEGTSMQDLVDGLGLSRSSIYETFGSKKELYVAALAKYEELSVDGFKSILYEEGPAKELLGRFFAKVIERNRDQSCLMVNATLEMGNHADVGKRVKGNCDFNESSFRQLLERAASRGEIASDQDLGVLSSYLVNVMHGLSVTAVTCEETKLCQIVAASLSFLR